MLTRLGHGRYFGEAVARRDVSGWMTAIESIYSPAESVPEHFHENPYFCIVVRGRFEETWGQKALSCGPTDVIFHPPGDVHSDQFDEFGGRCLSLEIRSDRFDSLCEARTFAHPQCFKQGRIVDLACRVRTEIASPDPFSALAIEGLGLQMCAELGRATATTMDGQPPRWLRRVRERLLEAFDDTWSLCGLAAEAGVHEAHLAREFHRFYGSSIGEYVRRLRIDAACRALSGTSTPIGAIAIQTGFADQAHFSRTFKRVVGTTPREFRRQSLE